MSIQLVFAFSLGAHLIALAAIAFVAWENERVRAYFRFVAALSLWIVLVLLHQLGIAAPASATLAGVVAHFLPVIFLLDRSLPLPPIRRRWAMALLAFSVVLLPFTLGVSPWQSRALEIAWFGGAWLLVALRIRESLARRADTDRLTSRRLVAVALIALPAIVGLLVAVGALAVIPLLSALVQAVVLYAIIRLSLYEVRTTASRGGVLAAEAAEHDRRAVAGEIAAMVAHEVRNPLTGVRSLAQRLAEDTVPEERRRRYSALIVREVDRVERMVSALLGASSARRSDPEQPVETPLTELLEDVGLLVSGRVRRAGIALLIEPASLVVAAPPEPLAQVLLNLVLNAITHAPAGSQIRISAAATGALVQIVVEDHGVGIRAENRERIFVPFYSGTGGSGLGLAVVRRICEERGWTVETTDTPGGGATFVLVVPRALAGGAAAPPLSAGVAKGSRMVARAT